jgi:hypothetical protein
MSTSTPQQVLASIVTGINTGDLESLLPLYESDAAFATEPGSLAHGAPGVRDALTGFISTAPVPTASRSGSSRGTPTCSAVSPTAPGGS